MPANSEKTAKKRGRGKPFVKGQSGNPSGRPKANPEVKEILKAASVGAARRLVELSQSDVLKIALQASSEILNRTEGKPRECLKMDVSGGLDVRAQVRSVLMERINGQSESGFNEHS